MQQEERFEENETFGVENNEAIEEIKIYILKEFFKTQNMSIEEWESLLKLETNRKNKLNIRIGNIALGEIIKDIKPKDSNIEWINILNSKSNYGKIWYEKEKQK